MANVLKKDGQTAVLSMLLEGSSIRSTDCRWGSARSWENFKASMDLYFTYYNFAKHHRTIRCTPAMGAGVARSALTVADLVDIAA